MIVIRPANQADIPSMAAIRAREWETEAYWVSRITGYLLQEHSPQMALAARAAFVAADGPVITGFVAGHQTRRFGCEGELEWINVAPEHRGQGIAGLLIVRMAGWFADKDLRRICVNVEPGNSAARSLYSRFGAARLNEYWMVWEDARRIMAS